MKSRRPVQWALFVMSRPDQLALIGLVYAMGSAIALSRGGPFDGSNAVAGLFAILLVSASVHYANEYADYFTDYLAVRTPFSGGSGALQQTGLDRRLPLRAGIWILGGGFALGTVCLLHGFPALGLAVLALIAVLGWSYSVGPAFAWHGFGELLNAFLGGIALPVYGYIVQTGTLSWVVILSCVPFSVLVFLNLLDTTWVDRVPDGAVGKRTLATRISRYRLRGLYAGGILVWLSSLFMLHGSVIPTVVVFANLSVAPLILWGFWWYTRRHSPFPSVAAMVLVAVLQFSAWVWIAL